MSDFSELTHRSKVRAFGIFKEAWQRLDGFKASAWGGIGFSLLVSIGVAIVLAIAMIIVIFAVGAPLGVTNLEHMSQVSNSPIVQVINQVFEIVAQFFTMPATVGLLLLAVKRFRQQDFCAYRVFDYYKWRYMWRFFMVMLLMYLLVFVIALIFGLITGVVVAALHGSAMGTIALSILTGLAVAIGFLLLVYFNFVFNFSMMQIAYKQSRVWKSIGSSFHCVNKNYWQLVGVFLMLVVVNIVIFCPGVVLYGLFSLFDWGALGAVIGVIISSIALVWLAPWALSVMGLLYRDVIGFDNEPHQPE